MNFLLIVADDLGYYDIGFRNKKVSTPNIDNLATNGIILDNFYVQSSCSPTRSSIMMGMYPYKLGTQRLIWPWNSHSYSGKFPFLPKILKQKNYSCKIFGKWNLGHGSIAHLPVSRGFDYHYGSHMSCMDHYAHKSGPTHDLVENNKAVYDKGHIADLITNKLICNLKNESENFFYYLAYNSPHLPSQVDKKYIDFYAQEKNKDRSHYLGMITHLDDCIGKVIKALKETNNYDDTLIWFTSDNGGFLPQGANNYPLRGGKAGCYEGGLKVANFIHCPKWNLKGSNQSIFHAIDIAPTFCNIAGIENVNHFDGIDIKNILLNNQNISNRTIIHNFFPFSKKDMQEYFAVIRHNDYKIHILKNDIEIYNIKNDPREERNLYLEDKNLKNDFDQIIKVIKNDYVYDPETWYQPNGPPQIWKPKITSEVKSNQITILENPEPFVKKYNFENPNILEILGYYNLLDKN